MAEILILESVKRKIGENTTKTGTRNVKGWINVIKIGTDVTIGTNITETDARA
jgi:hypothetical protein